VRLHVCSADFVVVRPENQSGVRATFLAQVTDEAAGLLKLGFIFMLSGVMMQGVMAAVNFILLHSMDEKAVGLYGQAWMLSGYLVGFVFQAMGTDYYPRLTAVANDNPRLQPTGQ
jgi:antigen flippase